MLAQSIRASRQALVRVARQQPTLISRRTFIIPTAVRQADLVQEMYLRELKSYKPPQLKASDSEGHVQQFSIPKPPPSPEEGDIASELKAYENQKVELEGASAEGAAPVEEDWFEEEVEEAPPAAH
ncbi:ATP synthase complex subunit H-domain-containing protein [Massariosphaeria phaeospora]|uniref:ATP synthase complex subunit H-domain-containing protein n=1 Tax=Massariosphaeria phaeospora TaxID=100035 RepID=A0A7C8M6E3_9PLEO|nr:ATP synthase complex subunit H-domain-containing protein [Massariosphaeria phaeospora]